MATLEISHVNKSFGKTNVLKDINLSVADGEFISLLGPSGSGKTTLLRIISGLLNPDNGNIIVGGKDITKVPAQKRKMGMVFQQYSLFPNMTVSGNIAFPLETAKRPKSEIKPIVQELLHLIGLEEHANKLPKQLSGGQQQRVALARALALEPTILLLDEPLSALDAKVRSRLREQIREIQQKLNITTVFVTHDQSEAFATSDRVVLMGDGTIRQMDTPEEVYSRPADTGSADFIGTRTSVDRVVTNGRVSWAGIFDKPVSLPDGTPVKCSFRSESVELDIPASSNDANATVISKTYLGANTDLRLKPLAAEGADTIVRATVDGSLAVRTKQGDPVHIIVEPHNVNVYVNDVLFVDDQASYTQTAATVDEKDTYAV